MLDAPLLFETGLHLICSPVVVVATSPEKQIARLMERDKCSREAAERMIAIQKPQEEKISRADIVLYNNGSVEELHTQLQQVWGTL